MVRKSREVNSLQRIKPLTKFRVAAFEAEMMKLHKKIFALEAEQVNLRIQIKALEEKGLSQYLAPISQNDLKKIIVSFLAENPDTLEMVLEHARSLGSVNP